MARRRRVNKSMILRICAVGLFVCLGTFAVMHSTSGKKDKQAETDTETENAEPNPAKSEEDAEKDDQTLDNGTPDNPSETTAAKKDNAKTTVKNGFAASNPTSSWPPKSPAISSSPKHSVPTTQKTTGQSNSKFSLGDSKLKSSTFSTNPTEQKSFVPAHTASAQKNLGFSNSPANQLKNGPPKNPAISDPKADSFKIPALVGKDKSEPNSASKSRFSAQPMSANSLIPPSKPPSKPTTKTNDPVSRFRSTFGNQNKPETNSRPLNTNNLLARTDLNQRSPTPAESQKGSTAGKSAGGTTLPPLRPVTRPQSSSLASQKKSSGAQNTAPQLSQFQSKLTPSKPSLDKPSQTANAQSVFSGSRQVPNSRQNNSPTPTTFQPTPAAPINARSPISRSDIGSQVTASPQNQLNPKIPSAGRLPVQPQNPGGRALAKATPGDKQFEGVQLPALVVQKVAPREVQVNRPATFELIVKNSGKVSASDVVVHDHVPRGTQLVSATPNPTSQNGGNVQWNLGTLRPGQQTSIKMKLLPTQPGNIGSVAYVTFGAQASAQTICTQPKLAIRHQAPETVLIGKRVLINVFVENKGNGAAENVVLQEDVPDGLEFQGGQRELEYEIGTLRPGETRNVQLRLTATKVGHVKNLMVAHGAGKLQASDTVNLRIVAPDLTLTGEGPTRKFLNRKATHSFNVANRGTASATNMQLIARLPRGLRFVEANNQGQYDPGSHAVVWRLARLDPQKSGKVSLTTMPVATGQQDINVEARADLNQRQATKQSLMVQQLVELFFDIDDTADPIETGSGTSYKVRVVNQGKKTATNVRIQVEFPNAIQPTAVDGGVRNEIRGQMVLIQPIPTLQPGQEISFVVRANGIGAGEHRTVVSVRSDDREIAVSKEESTHVYSDR